MVQLPAEVNEGQPERQGENPTSIAKETGGAHIDAETTNPHSYLREIADELRSSYEPGYYPSNPLKDNTFRKLVIRLEAVGLDPARKNRLFHSPCALSLSAF